MHLGAELNFCHCSNLGDSFLCTVDELLLSKTRPSEICSCATLYKCTNHKYSYVRKPQMDPEHHGGHFLKK